MKKTLNIKNKNGRPRSRLGFSYDFGVTVIRHLNAHAMVLASALMRGIHPLDNIQNGERPGGMPLISALA